MADQQEGTPALGRLRRLVPKTVLGFAAVLLCMSVAAAFSGAVLYAYYENRQEQTINKVEKFVAGFQDQLDAAKKIVAAEGDSAKQEIRNQLDELRQFAASGSTLNELLNKSAPSVFFVSTLDDNGAPSVGSAFVVFADSESSYLLTSYATVVASTRSPAPGITLRKQDEPDLDATLYTWDPGKDLALLQVHKPNLPALAWAGTDALPKVGDRLFAISGLGSAKASITQGFVADVSGDGIQHDAPVGSQFQGGPLLNSRGEVVGIASRAYSPLGFLPQSVFFAPLIRQACEAVLHCPDSSAAGPGAQPN
jgi:S1-C subfamily serine protease